ncbi:MAG TPA: DUF4126 domain-containing protein [Blastocatellia bacterium]|nr:DUF4126 domain-containing protein [Blastocatellia bacterium]
MDFISTLALGLGSAWVSGINLYAAVAALGLLGRFANLPLPGDLAVLTNGWVIGAASGLYLVEFVADKVPLVDSAWDFIHTFIRVPAGAVLAAGAFGEFDRSLQVIAFLVGGTLALGSHGTKATARAAINTSPEPFSNIGASLLEDGVAISSIFLAAFYPVVMLIVLFIFTVLAIIFLPRIFSFFRRQIARIRAGKKSWSETARSTSRR